MNNLCWWCADVASRVLEPDERVAVRGDLEETAATGAHALREVLGLVARRQAALWAGWRPWLALMGLVVPLGMLLGLVSRWWADGSAVYAWLYVNNWTSAYLDSPGSRIELVRHGVEFLLAFVTLACWSWTSGFVLGSLSRRAIWVNGALFCLVLFGELVAVPQHSEEHDAVFSLTFYSVVFPLLVRTALVLIPSVWGMRMGFRRATLPVGQAIACAVALITMTACMMRGLEMSAAGWLHVRSAWQLHLLPVVVLWPVGYILFTANWRPWRNGTTAI